jgi:hypothetical protein
LTREAGEGVRVVRIASLVVFVLLLSWVSASRADVPVAPAPREIRPDGTRDPAPEPEQTKKEDPREIVERIIKNSNVVGDKLAMTDTGTDTRKTQDKILKDIDALLNQDNPPPPKPDQSQDQQKDKNDMNQDMNKDMNKDKGQGGDPKDKKQDGKGGGMGKDMEPKGGGMDSEPMGGDQPKERRPRKGEGKDKQDAKDDPNMKQPGGGGGMQQKPDMKAGKPKDSKTGGMLPDPTGDTRPPSNPLLPVEDDVVKDVWGHLPEKLRQQATQYYKQEIMPRYSELLKRYYSSMAEKKQ